MLFNEETIEAYVSGAMTGADKSLFEAGMAKDPLLTREVEIQKDIFSGLQNHRRAELKQRLNNIDMSTATINLGTKVAASVLISMIVGGGLYLAINMTEQPQAVAVVQTTGQNAKVEKTETVTTPAAPAQTVAPEAQNHAVATPAPQVSRSAAAPATNSTIVVELPTIEAANDGGVASSGNEKTTNNPGLGSPNTVSHQVVPEISPAVDKNGGYSYQYYNDKLFLYGNFNSGAVNILEFNKHGKKQLFVYANKQYYQIKDNQTEIAPLKVIKDQSIINQLNNR